jgi:hypothetical protein
MLNLSGTSDIDPAVQIDEVTDAFLIHARVKRSGIGTPACALFGRDDHVDRAVRRGS